MLEKQCFTGEWVQQKKAELGGGDPTLIEKTIHAFALLAALRRRDVPLVFKGGTSLLLRLPTIHRLSIDVDILCSLPPAELDPVLADIAQHEPFLRYAEDVRGANRVPARRHFKFFYRPFDSRNPAPFVLLDVVQDKCAHPCSSAIAIRSPLLRMEEEVTVEVPTVEGLLGDKLTAFAPNTVGVRCQADTAMQVMKQLFDVGMLYDAASDLRAVAATYDAVFTAENSYRGSRFTREQALSDTLESARRHCHADLKGAQTHEHVGLMEQGRRALQGHLAGGRFTLTESKAAAAKAAFLASQLLAGRADEASIVRYDRDGAAGLAQVRLADPVLQRLRGGYPEAFYYWHKAEA